MIKTKLNQSLKLIFLLALLLRLILIPFFYHRDIKSQNFHLQYFSQGQLNIYQYIHDHQKSLPYQDTFNYLPLTYLGLGSIQFVLKPLLPLDFFTWVNDWGVNQDNYPNLFYFLLILKVPYIVFDFGIAFLLYKMYGKKFLNFWLFNPFSFYFIYILGNFDVIPVFFSFLSFYYLNLKQEKKSFLFLVIATAFKLYPLILLPFFLFKNYQNLKQIFINSIIFSLPLLFSILPFAFCQPFWDSFFGSGLTQKIFEFNLFKIPVFPALYIGLFSFYLFSKTKTLEKYILIIFLLFIIFVNYHPQWLLWFFPFILKPIFSSKKNTFLFLIITSLSLVYVFLINDQYLFWGHLIPINSNFIFLSTPYDILRYRLFQNPAIIQQYLKYIIGLLSIYYLIFLNREKNI
jgi:hypothetical protein